MKSPSSKTIEYDNIIVIKCEKINLISHSLFYFIFMWLGDYSYECKLCLTLHNNEGYYLAHTQGKRHQTNLAKRAAREAKEALAQPQPHKRKVSVRKTGKVSIHFSVQNSGIDNVVLCSNSLIVSYVIYFLLIDFITLALEHGLNRAFSWEEIVKGEFLYVVGSNSRMRLIDARHKSAYSKPCNSYDLSKKKITAKSFEELGS